MAQANRNIIHPAPVAAAKPAPVAGRRLTAKVTDKGGVSVYGLQRFPVTLYREQWEALLAHAPQILAFLEANAASLATKAEAAAPKDGRIAL